MITSSSTLAQIFTADIDMAELTTEVRGGVITAIDNAFEALTSDDDASPLGITTTQVLCEAVNQVEARLNDRTGSRNAAHLAYLQTIHLTLKNALNA
jgi:hypothetical protein